MPSRQDFALADTRARMRSRASEAWAAKEQALLDELHPKQRAFVLDPHRRVCALVGRGGGKTTGIGVRFIRRLKRTKRARCLYVATTRDQAIDLLWNPLKDACERLGMRVDIDVHFNETALRCTFIHERSTLRLVGADDRRQIEKYRGQSFHEVWIDEAASYPHDLLEHLIERVIAPRLGNTGGMIGMVGTPGHNLAGPFYEATRPGSPDHRHWDDRHDPQYVGWKAWSHHTWTLEDGAPHVKALADLWKEALVEKEAKGWSDTHPVWMREYLGRWAADDTAHVFRYRPHDDSGAELNQWNPPRKAFANLPGAGLAVLPDHRSDWHYGVGMDTGSADPTAIGIYAYSATDPAKRLYHVWEFERRQMYARTIAEVFLGPELDHDRPSGIIGAIGWPEFIVADAPETLLDELGNVYGITITRADKRTESRFASIELANGDLIDGRIKILKGSRLEEQLMQLQWVHNEFGEAKKDKRARDDQADQFIYARRACHHLLAREDLVVPPVERSEYRRAGREKMPEPAGEFDGYFTSDDGGPGDDYWG